MSAAAPTHNPLCDEVRAKSAAARAQWKLSPEALEVARFEAEHARIVLANLYRRVKDHPTLSVQAEVAGKGVKHLLAMIEARQTGAMQ